MNRGVKWFLLLCLCLTIGISVLGNNTYSLVFSNVPWKIKYSKYRLFYWINMSQVTDPTNFKVIINIPTTIIDDMLKYCEDHGYNNTTYGYRFCGYAWPRVYYIDNLVTLHQRQVLYAINATYKDVPQNITIYFDSVVNPLNTSQSEQWLVVYFPYYVWEDFEDLEAVYYTTTLTNSGQSYPDGWYILNAAGTRSAKIVTGNSNYEPTPKKVLRLHTYSVDYNSYITICKNVNIPINAFKFFNVTTEWTWYKSAYGQDAIYFTFNLSDGTQKTIAYYLGGAYYTIPKCNPINIGLPSGRVKRNVLWDLYVYCLAGTYNLTDVVSLWRICVSNRLYGGWVNSNFYIDNIRIIPSDIENYFTPVPGAVVP